MHKRILLHTLLGWMLLLAGLTASHRASADSAPPNEKPTPKPVILISDVATGLVGGWRSDVSDIDDG